MYKNILVPISPDHKGTVVKALEIARHLSDQDAKITALTVIEAVPGFASQYMPKGQKEETKNQALAALTERMRGADDVMTDVVNGHSGQTILDYAKAEKVDCIVITSHRPGLKDFFLGSTAARVVRYFKGSVHVLR